MSRRNAIILALLFVILVIEIVIVAPKEMGTSVAEDLAAAKRAKESAQAVADKGQSGQLMKDVHLVEAADEGKEWELWADQAVRPKDNERWTIEKVKVHFFADNGVMYTVTGSQGRVLPEKKDISIEGDVVTRSSNGYVFKTQSLDYNSSARKLTSPSAVEMTGPKDQHGGALKVTGGALSADFGSNEIIVSKNVKAKRSVNVGKNEQRMANIQADRAQFSARTNQAQFFGDVVIDVETMQLTGTQAKFAYDPRTQMLDSLQVAGGVKVTDSDKFATSTTVDLFFKENKVVFTGSPRVVQNGDELVGDEIVMLDGGKKVQVSNAKAQLEPKRAQEQPRRTE